MCPLGFCLSVLFILAVPPVIVIFYIKMTIHFPTGHTQRTKLLFKWTWFVWNVLGFQLFVSLQLPTFRDWKWTLCYNYIYRPMDSTRKCLLYFLRFTETEVSSFRRNLCHWLQRNLALLKNISNSVGRLFYKIELCTSWIYLAEIPIYNDSLFLMYKIVQLIKICASKIALAMYQVKLRNTPLVLRNYFIEMFRCTSHNTTERSFSSTCCHHRLHIYVDLQASSRYLGPRQVITSRGQVITSHRYCGM